MHMLAIVRQVRQEEVIDSATKNVLLYVSDASPQFASNGLLSASAQAYN